MPDYWSVREKIYTDSIFSKQRRKDQRENGNYYIVWEILNSEKEKVSLASQKN